MTGRQPDALMTAPELVAEPDRARYPVQRVSPLGPSLDPCSGRARQFTLSRSTTGCSSQHRWSMEG
jgi:hypothetical protein